MQRRELIKRLSWAGGAMLLSPSLVFASSYPTLEDALKAAFPGADSIEKKRAIANDEQIETLRKELNNDSLSRIFSYHEARKDGALLGYAVDGEVLGKHQMIDYIIALGPDLSIKHIEITAYRESYGYQIRAQRFLQQFYGKQPGDQLKLNKEVKNIANATISCRSMIRAVKEVHTIASVLLASEVSAAVDSSDAQYYTNCAVVQRASWVMGTMLTIQAANSPKTAMALDAAFVEVRRLEKLLNRHDPTSEIGQLDRGRDKKGRDASPRHPQQHQAYEVSQETYALIERADKMSLETHGRFIPGRDYSFTSRDSGGCLRQASLPSIKIAQGGFVDLGGIAKGYALDRAAAILDEHGVSQVMLNFGGQILALDPLPGQQHWEVNERYSGQTYRLKRQSLAVSGSDQQGAHFWKSDGQTKTRGQRHATAIVAPSAETADALATACHLAPDAEARKTACRFGAEVYFV